MEWRVICRAVVGSLVCGVLVAGGTITPPPPMEWAFRFASAITADEVDQGAAQAKVLTDLLAAGDLAGVEERVNQMRSWRAGIVWAELSSRFADRGQTNEAVRAIRQAERIRLAMRLDWQSDRIGAHLSRAYARHGNVLISRGLAANLPPEEAAKARGGGAFGLVSEGKAAEALAHLREAEEVANFDVQNGLAEGYVDLAQHPALDDQPERRREALDGARRLLVKLPVVRRLLLARDIAREYRRAGSPALAREVLEAAEAEIRRADPASQDNAPFFGWYAVEWLELGETARAKELLALAGRLATAGDPMEQPGACAVVGECLWRAGDHAAARDIWERGLEIAAGFVNARPRALAVVELCRAWGRQQVPLDEATQTRLQKLFEGLADPW